MKLRVPKVKDNVPRHMTDEEQKKLEKKLKGRK